MRARVLLRRMLIDVLGRAWFRALGGSCAMLGLAGCPSEPPAVEGDAGDPSTSTTTASDPSPSTTAPADDTRGTASSSETGIIFLPEPDVAAPVSECDIFQQDCPRGEKCMLWASDGGHDWNASKCVPIAEDPAGADEPCHVEGWPTSGLDDCALGMMCWDVDPDTLQGTCVPFCVESKNAFVCEDPQRHCFIGSVLALCLRACDPLGRDCEGSLCIPQADLWICAPDASGDMGAYGDPCEFINVCDPGLVCLDESSQPPGLPCEGSLGCCTELCDITDPLGSLQCTGVAQGQQCVPWYEEGNAPAGLEHVGACALPP